MLCPYCDVFYKSQQKEKNDLPSVCFLTTMLISAASHHHISIFGKIWNYKSINTSHCNLILHLSMQSWRPITLDGMMYIAYKGKRSLKIDSVLPNQQHANFLCHSWNSISFPSFQYYHGNQLNFCPPFAVEDIQGAAILDTLGMCAE